MKFAFFFLLIGTIGCKTIFLTSSQVQYERITSETAVSDQTLDSLIMPYKEEMDEQMREVIGHLEVDIIKERPESTIGNWLADMMAEEVRVSLRESIDFALQNHGGIRLNILSAGPVTVGEIYEVMPFDNLIVIMEASGEEVKRLFDHIASSGGWPVSEEVRFVIVNDKAEQVTVGGLPLSSTRVYRFALPDYVANGGSDSGFLRDYGRQSTGLLVRDAFINHIRRDTDNGINQHPIKDGRIQNISDE